MITRFYLYVQKFLREEQGDQLLEIALIITLVVIVAMAGLQTLGVNILSALNRAAAAIGGG